MSDKGMNTGAKATLLGGGAIVLSALVWWGYWAQEPAPTEPVAQVTEASSQAESAVDPTTGTVADLSADPVAAAQAVSSAEAVEADSAMVPIAPPSFDTVRIETDGSALVAGRATAGADVHILLDGAELAHSVADGTGGFAVLFSLPPADAPRLMTLLMTLADGAMIASAESVAVAATYAPAVGAIEAAADDTAAEPGVIAAPGQVDTASAEPAAPAALLLSESGAELIQGDAAPLSIVTIDAITYTAQGDVQLSGQGAAGAPLRLYLDNAEVMTLTVPETGVWFVTLPQIAPGLYALRADQLDTDGNVTSRFETPFQRETLAALAAVSAPAEPSAVTSLAEATSVETTPTEDPPSPMPDLTADTVAQPEATASSPPALAISEPAPATAVPPEPAALPATETVPAGSRAPISVTVQPGFTLWQIARENFGSGVMYVQVFEANRDKIKNPDLIYPGQVFSVPKP